MIGDCHRAFGRKRIALTARELEVLRAILNGYTANKELCRVLIISERTVQTHISNIFAQTGAMSKAELILMAIGHIPCSIDLVAQLAAQCEGSPIDD